MKSVKLRNSIILVITAFIWGIAFAFQSTGSRAIGAHTFNFARNTIGGLFLLLLIFVFDKIGWSYKPKTKEDKKNLIVGGLCCGIVLFFASTTQQVALFMGAEAGKAGFLTACYILLVPIIGIFFKKKCGIIVWISVIIAACGLYFLCINEALVLKASDILLMVCALCYSFHILVIDHFSPLTDGIRLSCIQTFTTAVVSFIVACFFEIGKMDSVGAWLAQFDNKAAWIAILYTGIMSSGIAYTMQIIGQKGLNPAVASIIMSLESVFSVLGGAVLLHEILTGREMLGCALIFVAIISAQLPENIFKKKVKEEKANE